jgi:hypothetical protein
MSTTGINPDGSIRQRLDQLPRQAALYPTPNKSDATRRSPETFEQKKARGAHTGTSLIDLGPVVNGPSELTEKRGGLNPEFVCWLMGFPVEWLFAAPSDMATPRTKKRTGIAGKAD